MNKKDRRDLYYLLPGQGRGGRERYKRNLVVGWIVGLGVSGLMGWLIWFLNR